MAFKIEQMVLEGWGSVNLSHCLHVNHQNSAALNEKGGTDLLQPWSDLDPNYPLVGTSIIFDVVFQSHFSNLG